MYEIGDIYTSTVNVTDSTGTLVDPSTAVVTVTLPDASTATPTVTHVSTGIYSTQYTTTQSGYHEVKWVGTGAAAFTQSDVFNVVTADPGLIVSLFEARKGIGFADANKISDEDVRGFIYAATPIMEDIIGSSVTRLRVETFNGGSPQIQVLYPPVKSITSVIESWGSSFTKTLNAVSLFTGSSSDAYSYDVDLVSGTITRRSNGIAVGFMPGVRNIQVTYVAGRVLAGNHLMATRRLIRFLWQTEQQGFRPAFGTPDGPLATTPSGFEVPRMVIVLCADSVRPPGVA